MGQETFQILGLRLYQIFEKELKVHVISREFLGTGQGVMRERFGDGSSTANF